MDNYPRLRELLFKLYQENHKISFIQQQVIPDFEVKDFDLNYSTYGFRQG